MASFATKPQPTEFGISASMLNGIAAPLADRRCGLVCVVVLTAIACGLGLALFRATGSLAAAIFFAPLLTVASLILVGPLMIAALCAACAIERRWRGASDPQQAACNRYLNAVERWQRQRRPSADAEARLTRRVHWQHADREALLQASVTALGSSAELLDRELTGADLRLRAGGERLLVRVQPGEEPVAPNVLRELAMARVDLGANRAVLVAPGGIDPQHASYLEAHAISWISADELPDPPAGRHNSSGARPAGTSGA